MKFRVKPVRATKTEAEVLVLLVTAENWERELTTSGKDLISHLSYEGYTAKKGSLHAFPTYGKIPAKEIVVCGLGKMTEVTVYDIRVAAARAANYARTHKRTSLALDLTGELGIRESMHEVAKVVVEGVVLGSYRYSKYKSETDTEKALVEVSLITTPGRLQHAVNGVVEGELYAQGTIFARDLINESPTVTTPAYLANVAKQLAKNGDITVEVLEKKEVAKLGMGAYLAVNQGSAEPPKFIKLTYKGGKKKIVIAGKTITFDTGGLQIKDYKNMETMKLDMSGGAAVLGLFSVIPKLKPKATVIGLLAATENMPGSRAMKPGDIVRAANGKTIEILHTDAEGRLTLADMLSQAVKEKPEAIIDLATLTGACMVALGEEITGLFTNNAKLGNELKRSSEQAGEKLWELPLEKSYRDSIKSDLADLRNISKTRYGGAITAALFLEEFVDDVPWAHLDIAGPAFAEQETPLSPKGGTGFGVRTLLNFLKDF